MVKLSIRFIQIINHIWSVIFRKSLKIFLIQLNITYVQKHAEIIECIFIVLWETFIHSVFRNVVIVCLFV